jgi:hypothetical protein
MHTLPHVSNEENVNSNDIPNTVTYPKYPNYPVNDDSHISNNIDPALNQS